MLARWLEQHCRPEQLIPIALRLGTVPMPRGLNPALRSELVGLRLPLPSARLKLDTGDSRLALAESVLAEEGLQMKQLQVKGIRELFFSKGERAALCVPANLRYGSAEDDRRPGRKKLHLAFDLPRGSYATLIVKRITDRGA
jgi:tRNA pseudouridine13 synthase